MLHEDLMRRPLAGERMLRRLACGFAFISLPVITGALPGDEDEALSSAVPSPENLGAFVKDMDAARELGKALFWDENTGGDGRVACATCHFAIGADARVTNTMNPGSNGIFDVVPVGGTLHASDFPFDADDIVGSQGVSRHDFLGIVSGSPVDMGTPVDDPTFGTNRRVTGRNTPTNIMSVLNEENFWDGRARNTFNGVHPGGADAGAFVFRDDGSGAMAVTMGLENSSSSSQAVGPPNNEVEMSFGDGATNGRTWSELGKKMLSLEPLGQQVVDSDDSVLGSLANGGGSGLSCSYADLIMDAFHDEWWDSSTVFTKDRVADAAGTFSLMETNFALFWGIAQQVYEAELIPNDTAFDRGDMTERQERGFDIFEDDGRCDSCHREPEFTNAAFTNGGGGGSFSNTGVRPMAEDPGAGDGEFKSSTLRNTELTGPYFHNGGKSTLRQVVEFYNRGGDHTNEETDSDIRPLGLSDADMDALVDFMMALTDDRLRIGAAPFDHPSLSVPNGPDLAATGAAGGDAIGTFLGADPFDSGGGPVEMARSSTSTLSLTEGGTQTLTLRAPGHAGQIFVVATRAGSGAPRMLTFGQIDASGHAVASFRLPAGLSSSLTGIQVDHVFVVLQPSLSMVVSNMVSVQLMP